MLRRHDDLPAAVMADLGFTADADLFARMSISIFDRVRGGSRRPPSGVVATADAPHPSFVRRFREEG